PYGRWRGKTRLSNARPQYQSDDADSGQGDGGRGGASWADRIDQPRSDPYPRHLRRPHRSCAGADQAYRTAHCPHPHRGERIMAWTREQMAARAARELEDGFYVNLGIGIPTLVAGYIPEGMDVRLQSENGMLGMGPFPFEGEEDADLINAGKQTITALPETSFFSSADSFAMIRGGHIDLSILGAMQVAQNGDLANWMIPGKMAKGMGGALDLVAGVKRVVVVMEPVATGKDGAEEPKLLRSCNLPLSVAGVVDLVVTDLGVFEIDKQRVAGMRLIALAVGVTLEEIKAKTQADFAVALQEGRSSAA